MMLSLMMASSSISTCAAEETTTETAVITTQQKSETSTEITTAKKKEVKKKKQKVKKEKNKQKYKEEKKSKKKKSDKKKKGKDNEKEKKKSKKVIKMPKRVIKKKGCISIQKRIDHKKELIERAKKTKKNIKIRIRKETEKKDSLNAFYNKNDQEVAYQGQLITPLTKLNEKDKEMRDDLLNLSDLYQDTQLAEIATKYVFGLHESNFESVMNPEDTINLNDYLKTKYAEPVKRMENEIQKIDEKIQSLKSEIQTEKKTRYFDPKDVSSISNITVDDAKQMLSGTELYQDAASFVKAERLYHVNAVFLMGIAAHESAWGASRRAREDNNLTGYGVYSDDAEGINKDSREDGLLATANTLHERYLTKGGSYYEGTSVADVNKHYCIGDEWAPAVVNYGYQLMNKLN